MGRADLDRALDWAAMEGWNPGLHDAECFWAADPGGFLVGELAGEAVAGISAVAYGADFGFLGLFIVAPEHRGRGFGRRLWRAGLARLGGRNVGLDGDPARPDGYHRSGFRLAYRNVRFEGAGRAQEASAAVDLASLPFAQVAAYDRELFPAPRERFLERWIAVPDGRALGLLETGRLSGYGVIRRCRTGHKIGPLFADGADQAEALFRALSATAPGEPLVLDVPEPNAAAVALARGHGMKAVFETARMYRGKEPDIPLRRVFGVTTLELG